MDIKNHLATLSFKQLKDIAKHTNLHYHIKLTSRAIVTEALNRLYNYNNGVYGSKPFELVVKDGIPKQHLVIKKNPTEKNKLRPIEKPIKQSEITFNDILQQQEEPIEKPIEKPKMKQQKPSKVLKFEDFKDVDFIRRAIDLYYSHKGQKLTNLGKFSRAKLKEIIERRKIDLNELSNMYVLAILNSYMNKPEIPEKYKKMIADVKTDKLDKFMNDPDMPEDYRRKIADI
jgi:hypothetical protein